jgi:glycine reductase
VPRLAYIGQIHSRQRVAEVDEQILYGVNTDGMVPVLLHPNEWLDGALVTSHSSRGVETYFYQNHPILTELYHWHRDGRIILVGTIATMAGSDNDDRPRNCMLAAQQAKWALAADGVILTKYGGGAPHADMALTARMCEQLGMRTTVQVEDMSQDRRAESAMLFNYAEVDAMVHVGGNDTRWSVPAVERAIAGDPEVAAVLGQPQQLEASRICGVTSQQGASRLRSLVY